MSQVTLLEILVFFGLLIILINLNIHLNIVLKLRESALMVMENSNEEMI